MFCSNCGANLRGGERFCMRCGSRQSEAQTVPGNPSGGSAGMTPVYRRDDLMKMNRKRNGRTAAILIPILLVVGLMLVGGVILLNRFWSGVFFDLRDVLGGAGGGFYDQQPDGEPFWSEQDRPLFPGRDFSEFEELVGGYFVMLSEGNPEKIADFLHTVVVEALEREGFSTEEFAEQIDSHSMNYGARTEEYQIKDVMPYSNSEYEFLSEKLDFDQAEIQQYVYVSVDVTLVVDSEPTDWVYRFDMIKVREEWSIIGIW